MKKRAISPLLLGGLLVACGGGTPTPAPNPNAFDPATLSGKLSDWKDGALTPQLYSRLSEEYRPLGGSSVGSDGTVNVTLPVPERTFGLIDSCSFSGTRSVSDVQIDLADVVLATDQDDLLGEVLQARSNDGQALTRLYAATDAILKGTVSCGVSGFGMDLNLKAGWNAITAEQTGPGGLVQLVSVERTTPVTLKFSPYTPEVAFSFADNSPVVLRAGQTVKREVRLYQDGGISGEITLSTNLPGVTVTPGTLTLPSLRAQGAGANRAGGLGALEHLGAQAVTTTLTFALGSGAASANGELQVLARQNGQTVGTARLSADIRVPSAQVRANGDFLSGYVGESSALALSLTPQDGLSGPVTVGLVDPPAGVSAAPVQVTLTPNTTTNLELPVQVAAGTALGDLKVQVGGASLSPATATLRVKPARTRIEVQQAPSGLTPAAQGVWITSAYTYTAGAKTQATFQRLVGGKAAAEVKLENVSGGLISIPGGDVYAAGTWNDGGKKFYRFDDAGKVTTYDVPAAISPQALLSGPVADAQGRVWYVGIAKEEVGVFRYGLFVWTPATGQIVAVDPEGAYSGASSNLVFSRSASGRYLLYLGGYNSKPVLIDTETAKTTVLPTTGGGTVESGAVSDTGEAWLLAYGALTRVNTDGTSTTFPAPSGASYLRLLGFDRQQPGVLWLTTSQGMARVATGGTPTLILTDQPIGSALNAGGGLTFLTTGSAANGTPLAYLSTLP
ncbi:hypothetical protein [Deinococcus petrolearius]|uniref:Uncharacterized protein n=1 Tax=Deinococcus petrolearius TaxID=1751295 RepID=A0ABW1DM73_9DEIO